MAQEVYLTKEGFKEKQERLEYLKNEGRIITAEKLKTARSFGDLSENSEYDEAKSDQAKLEAEINDLEAILANAKIIEEDSSTEKVHLGSVVTIKDTTRGSEERTFTITSFAQSNAAEGKLSDESPVGKALLGHKVGDKVTVEIPKGTVVYKIIKIAVEHK